MLTPPAACQTKITFLRFWFSVKTSADSFLNCTLGLCFSEVKLCRTHANIEADHQ